MPSDRYLMRASGPPGPSMTTSGMCFVALPGLQPPADLQRIDAGKRRVEDDEVSRALVPAERLFGDASRHGDAVAQSFEMLLDGAPGGVRALEDEDLRGSHGARGRLPGAVLRNGKVVTEPPVPELLLVPPQRDHVPYAHDQLGRAHGLREELVGARLQAVQLVLDAAQPRDEDDRDVPGPLVAFQAPRRLVAADARHEDVHQDQVGGVLLRQADRLLPARRLRRLPSRVGELRRQESGDDRFVVNDENAPVPRVRGGRPALQERLHRAHEARAFDGLGDVGVADRPRSPSARPRSSRMPSTR